jgi:DNA-binding NarL/FixJ family response regulator
MIRGGGSAGGVIRVAVSDERRLIAEAIAALVDAMEGFEATGIVAGDAAIAAQHPDLLVACVGARPQRTLKFIRHLRHQATRMPMVILVDEIEAPLVRFAVDEQLNGLLTTDADAADIAVCLQQAARGHAVMPAGWQTVLAESGSSDVESLSARQLEVLKLVAEGLSYEEIGTRLFISLNTVKFHVRTIYSRLGVTNRVAAARRLAVTPPAESTPD